uniref:Putative homing endonuclease n=1 Tax=viral metagenome TaxID=1070528 RepID=A0A6M3LUB5_9ZZZZ
MKIKERQAIYNKYGCRCAYCGKEIKYKDMQVDHIEPQTWRLIINNSFSNLNPSCRRCNHYKRDSDLEQFRGLMRTLHKRIQEKYINKVAIDYGIIEIKPFDGLFYFEKV